MSAAPDNYRSDRRQVPPDRREISGPIEADAAMAEASRAQARRKAKADANLDEALNETFPASDPVSPFIPP
jgi:hypothetical protein